MKIHEVIYSKYFSQLNEIIEFDEIQYEVEVLTDVSAKKVNLMYHLLVKQTDGFTKHPKLIFDADEIEDLFFDVSHYYEDYNKRLTNCHQSIRMLIEVFHYLDSYYF